MDKVQEYQTLVLKQQRSCFRWAVRRPPDDLPWFGELEGHREGDWGVGTDDQTDPIETELIPVVVESAKETSPEMLIDMR